MNYDPHIRDAWRAKLTEIQRALVDGIDIAPDLRLRFSFDVTAEIVDAYGPTKGHEIPSGMAISLLCQRLQGEPVRLIKAIEVAREDAQAAANDLRQLGGGEAVERLQKALWVLHPFWSDDCQSSMGVRTLAALAAESIRFFIGNERPK